MLWYCRFTWYPGTTTARVRQRVVQQHALGTNHPDRIKGWYNLAGGGAGFMLVESQDPRELGEMLEPYMDLMAWDVHAAYELPYNAVTAHLFPTATAAGAEAGHAAGPASPPFTSASGIQSADGAPPLPEEEQRALDAIFRAADEHLRRS